MFVVFYNEGEWKAVGTYGDFNYITNRKTMQDYWETRIKTNGKYENTYTLGLRGIHDYPMEGANSTAERVKLMQQAINDQRDMLRRNINKPVEEIPQVLCTYEEVLEAYHNGLQVPEDVTLLWSDDKHGYCRNLCNPDELTRKEEQESTTTFPIMATLPVGYGLVRCHQHSSAQSSLRHTRLEQGRYGCSTWVTSSLPRHVEDIAHGLPVL